MANILKTIIENDKGEIRRLERWLIRFSNTKTKWLL